GGGAGCISAARAIATSRGVEIYGNVQTTWGYEAPLHAHVDIFFRLKDGKIIPGRAVDYFPRTIPPKTRGSIPLSHFFAQFDALPEQTDAVLLRFDQVEKCQCDLAIPTTRPPVAQSCCSAFVPIVTGTSHWNGGQSFRGGTYDRSRFVSFS